MSKGLDQAVGYLAQHKEAYSLKALKIQLQNAGYPKEVVDEAVAEVFLGKKREELQARGFFDFKNKRVYKSLFAKVGDVLFGFVSASVFTWFIYSFVGNVFGYRFNGGGLIVLAILGFVIFYLWRRRYYFAMGVLFIFFINLLTLFILGILFNIFDYWL